MAATPCPLFERLCAPADTPAPAGDLRSLRAAMAAELSLLLNTRSRLGLQAFCASSGSVVDFGIPDIAALSPASGEDTAALQRALVHALRCFEPRLLQPNVQVGPAPGAPHRARVRIAGSLRLGSGVHRVEFDVGVTPAATSVTSWEGA